MENLPEIIQGGMGIGVSNWQLAQAVSKQGQLGVVSGTAIDIVLVRRLQRGDPGGHMRQALAALPRQDVAEAILDAYYVAGGIAADQPYAPTPMPTVPLDRSSVDLMVAANFCEVYLAKQGHQNPVGINYLVKVQFPTLPSLFGALLAGVDYVIMGGGIPLAIPGILDKLSRWEPVELAVELAAGKPETPPTLAFDPRPWHVGDAPELCRPAFLPIVSSDIVAKTVRRRATGEIQGLVVEHHSAGGHNAPPRRVRGASADDAPRFGPRDEPDIDRIQALGLPFWLGGSYGSPEKLLEARGLGATGVQVGTAFAFCQESGMAGNIKERVIRHVLGALPHARSDFRASPTGYPFKVLPLSGALGDTLGTARKLICDLGYLRDVYVTARGALGYRCPAEPRRAFIAKGGDPAQIPGRVCLCNALLAAIGLGQRRDGGLEPPIVTTGADLGCVRRLAEAFGERFSASDVLSYLRGAPGALGVDPA